MLELEALLRQGALELPTLTDDELAALEPLVPPHARIVPLRSLFDLPASDWPARAEAGEASLVERGLLRPEGEGLVASDELRALLLGRVQPRTVTIADVVDSDGELAWEGAYYGLDSDAFRLEEARVGAEHRFRLCEPGDAATELARTIDPNGRAAGTPESPADAIEALDAAERRVRLLAVRRTGAEDVRQHEAQLVVAPRGVWLVAGLLGASTGAADLAVRPLVPSTLVDVLRRFVLAVA